MKVNLLNFVKIFFLALLLIACEPRSLDEFNEEGHGIIQSLIVELQGIQTRDDLLQREPRLKGLFEELAEVMMNARLFQEKSHLDPRPLSPEDHELSDQLRIELNRVYRLEGASELVEKCQETALHRLDAFEKHLNKHKK